MEKHAYSWRISLRLLVLAIIAPAFITASMSAHARAGGDSSISLTIDPGSGAALHAGTHHDGGRCRFKVTASIKSFEGGTVRFELGSTPSYNSSLTDVSFSVPEGTSTRHTYVIADGFCTGNVSAVLTDGNGDLQASNVAFKFVSGQFAPSASYNGSGSGSWSITGPTSEGSYAQFRFDGGTWYTGHGVYSPVSYNSGALPLNSNNLQVECRTSGISGQVCQSSVTGQTVGSISYTWLRNLLSPTGVPFGYSVRTTSSGEAYARSVGTDASSEGSGGITPVSPAMASAIGNDDNPIQSVVPIEPEYVCVYPITEGTTYVTPSPAIKATASSYSARSISMPGVAQGESSGWNSIIHDLIHTHINP